VQMKRIFLLAIVLNLVCCWAFADDAVNNRSLLRALGKESRPSTDAETVDHSEATSEDMVAEDEPASSEEETVAQFKKSPVVYIGEYSVKYHRNRCRYKDDGSEPVTRGEAEEKGYKPCGICRPAG